MPSRSPLPSRSKSSAAPAVASRRGLDEAPLHLRRLDGSSLALAGQRCAVMAILNLTPDSFSDGGSYLDPQQALERAAALVAEGADILDVGAESTRPGAALLTVEEEWARLGPLLELLLPSRLPVVLSLDTRRAEIARRAAAAGVRLLNLTFPQHLLAPVLPDPPSVALSPAECRQLLLRFDGVVVMHARGTPATMKADCSYRGDLCQTVLGELLQTVSFLGGEADPVLRSRLIFDPGLGFAKTAEQSLELLGRLGWLRRAWGGRLLIGASRKSMLGAITGLPPGERLVPSTTAAALAAYQGADVVRVHDVAATVAALKVVAALRRTGGEPA